MRGDRLGALHGVPIAIKDFTPTKGKTTTRGSAAFRNWVPDRDAVIVERLAGAGAILLGKTTTPEFAYSGFTRSPLWGHTRNPWDASRNAGGSSGGSGVAVATGCVALAEGSDMGGSVRIPAAFCGIVGLKPSLGRIPMDILFTSFDSISHFGPLARTVEDAKLFLEVTQGPHDADIQSQVAPTPLPRQLTGDMTGRRIALSRDLGFIEVAPDVVENLMATARHLEARGAVIEEVALDWRVEVVTAWYAYWGVFLAAGFGDCLERFHGRDGPCRGGVDRGGAEAGRGGVQAAGSGADAAVAGAGAHTGALRRAAVPDHDARRAGDGCGGKRAHRCARPAAWPRHDLAVQQRVPVPGALGAVGVHDDGLPTGVQIVGRRFDDPTVLEIGKAVEACCRAALPSALPL
jgi:Asp-tRNA(Asn)/Glu-tRNA(Gln) amidotransferase A subunit family amidase